MSRIPLLSGFVILSLSPIGWAAETVDTFLSNHCLECHDDLTKKGDLSMDQLSTSKITAESAETWALILKRIEAGEMPPSKKKRPPEEALAQVMAWTKEGLAEELKTRRGEGGSLTRRLNRLEYENTIHDLLGVKVRLRQLLPEDDAAHGFNTSAEGLRISPVHIQRYLDAADLALQAAVVRGPEPEPKVHRMQYDRESESRFFGQKSKGRMMVLKDGELRFYCDPGVEHPAYLEQFSRITNRQPGVYKIRVAARTLDGRGEEVSFGIRTASKKQRLGIETIAWFDAPEDDYEVFETEARFEAGETIILEPYRLNMMRRDRGFSQYAPGDHPIQAKRKDQPKDLPPPKGLALSIGWLEMEGPLPDEEALEAREKLFAGVTMVACRKLPNEIETPGYLSDLRRGDQLTPHPDQPEKEAHRLLTDFLPRAFRRPVSEEEVTDYVGIVKERLARSECFESAMMAAYRAVLCSPDFLFLPGQSGKLDDHALASRLSYFLWRTAPDERLRELADAGKLGQPETLRQETERLLNSPKSTAFIEDFVNQWLHLRNIHATQPDKFLFPEFFIQDGPTQFRDDGLLVQSMLDETRLFVADLIKNDGSVKNLIDSDFTYLNNRLAEYYKLPEVAGSEMRRVALPAETVRGGVLTQASVLKVTANGTRTSPVVRGVWVVENILDRKPLPPPPDAGSIDPDTRGSTTIREQLALHQNSSTCASCHRQIDPPGFALESFDPAGQLRDHYRTLEGVDELKERRPQPAAAPGEELRGRDILGPMSHLPGQPVDASGALVNGKEFIGPGEFKNHLLEEPDVIARALASKLITFSAGRHPEPGDVVELERIVAASKEQDYGLRSLLHGVIQSHLFNAF